MFFILKLKPKKEHAEALAYKSKRKRKREVIANMKRSLLSKVPNVKPIPLWAGFIVFTMLSLIGLSIGATIATYIFFGIATLVGFIALCESNKWVRLLVTRSNKAIDVLLFGFTIWATATLGITITASLVFAGIGFTLVYAPWLRQREELHSLINI